MAAFLLSLFHVSVEIQLLGFVIVSFVLLIFTRPFALKCLSGRVTRTNADSLIGRIAVATKEINNLAQTGEVDIADISWTARSRDDLKIIPAGSKVKICAIEGVKLIVEEIKEEIK